MSEPMLIIFNKVIFSYFRKGDLSRLQPKNLLGPFSVTKVKDNCKFSLCKSTWQIGAMTFFTNLKDVYE